MGDLKIVNGKAFDIRDDKHFSRVPGAPRRLFGTGTYWHHAPALTHLSRRWKAESSRCPSSPCAMLSSSSALFCHSPWLVFAFEQTQTKVALHFSFQVRFTCHRKAIAFTANICGSSLDLSLWPLWESQSLSPPRMADAHRTWWRKPLRGTKCPPDNKIHISMHSDALKWSINDLRFYDELKDSFWCTCMHLFRLFCLFRWPLRPAPSRYRVPSSGSGSLWRHMWVSIEAQMKSSNSAGFRKGQTSHWGSNVQTFVTNTSEKGNGWQTDLPGTSSSGHC